MNNDQLINVVQTSGPSRTEPGPLDGALGTLWQEEDTGGVWVPLEWVLGEKVEDVVGRMLIPQGCSRRNLPSLCIVTLHGKRHHCRCDESKDFGMERLSWVIWVGSVSSRGSF